MRMETVISSLLVHNRMLSLYGTVLTVHVVPVYYVYSETPVIRHNWEFRICGGLMRLVD